MKDRRGTSMCRTEMHLSRLQEGMMGPPLGPWTWSRRQGVKKGVCHGFPTSERPSGCGGQTGSRVITKELVSILLGVRGHRSPDPWQGEAHCISRVRMGDGGSSMVKGDSRCLEAGRLRFKS